MKDAFTLLAERLEQAGAVFGPAEAHGLFCGLLAVDPATPTERCVAELLGPEGAMAGEERRLVSRLMAALVSEARTGLLDENLNFQVFLPAPESPLRQRLVALTRWCDGFVGGVGLAVMDARRKEALPATVSEFLRDLGEIARLEPETEEDEEAERAYAELLEYVRMGALLAAAELRPPQAVSRGIH